MKQFLLYSTLVLTCVCCTCSGIRLKKPLPSTNKTSNTEVQPLKLTTQKKDSLPAEKIQPVSNIALSKASQLLIDACDNYISVNKQSPKIPEVLGVMASVYYNNKLFDQSRFMYKKLVTDYAKTTEAVSAIRMIAQSYYEEKHFDSAQVWYRTLRDNAADGGDKSEATTRLAESVFKMAEALEASSKFKEASIEYERLALEFPDSKIADVALFNSGLCYEKIAEWQRAILMFERLSQKYHTSKLLVKAWFRSAKCYEKLFSWTHAGEMYLRVVASFPQSDLAPAALYNAGFCFENANQLAEAAATFEKLPQLYPKAEDAADVLFKAGEIYGKLKDWPSVTRVNQEFTRRFGNDLDRAVQALCMVGVSLYMQKKSSESIIQLERAVYTYTQLKNPSTANKYYAANAQFTIAEILHESMQEIALAPPEDVYKRLLKQKSELLSSSVKAYSKVVNYGILEWTTRSIFQIGQAYEDYGLSVANQKRPALSTLETRFGWELGIAKAVDQYYIDNALHYHEQNVKLGIKEKLDDKYILASKQKLTYLPYAAGANYLALADIFEKATDLKRLEGFALIGKKLELLQKIAPYQERAIALFLVCLEKGSLYSQIDDMYTKSSQIVIKTATTVGTTYADVADIARDAPIPSTFGAYEMFVYKTKLLKQIETYEEQALVNYLKAIKIDSAYALADSQITLVKNNIPRVLFLRGRCYDILGYQLINDPPFPPNADEAQRQEYRAQFEEISLTYQETSVSTYESILEYNKQNQAQGDFVTQAYIRLFQLDQKKYGKKTGKPITKQITAGPNWKCTTDSLANWNKLDAPDSLFVTVEKVDSTRIADISGFPTKQPKGMWAGISSQTDSLKKDMPIQLFFRTIFYTSDIVASGTLYIGAVDECNVFFNERELLQDSTSRYIWNKARVFTLDGQMRQGKNVIAVYVKNNLHKYVGLYPLIEYPYVEYEFLAQPPGATAPLPSALVAEGVYQFTPLQNFIMAPRVRKPQPSKG